MRIRLINSAGWAALCVPVVSSAVMPTSFGGWAATSGVVSATCPSGLTCTDVAQSSGFLQRSLKDTAGKTYFQTIIIETGASGLPGALNFSTENFVRRNPDNTSGPLGGIANHQVIKDDSVNKWDKTNSALSMDSTIKTKWSTDTTSPSIVTNQSISESGTAFDTKFLSTYKFEENISELGVRSGYAYDIGQLFSQQWGKDQSVGKCDKCSSTTTPYEVQGFTRRLRSGDMSKSAGTGTLPSGRSVTWNAGETVAVTWAGQVMNHWEELESNEGTPGWEDLEMSFQAYENLSSGQAPSRYMAYGSSAPLDWNTATFGAAPVMPALPKGTTGAGSSKDSKGTTTPAPSTLADVQFQAAPVTLSSSTVTDTPVQFSNWSVSNGVISAACPPGAGVCISSQSSEGMLQRMLRGSDGKDYIQLIITDSNATGTPANLAFASESLVQMGNATKNGIISQMLLRDVGNSMFGFADRAVVRTGWGDSATQPNIDLEQHFATKIASEYFEFKNDFAYKANLDANNDRTGFWMDIDQTQVGTYNLGRRGASSTGFSSRTDQGMFVRREIAGDMLTSGGTSTSSKDGGGSLGWVAGDDIKVTWFGQVFNGPGESQPRFYYQAYDRVNDTSAPNRSANRDGGPGPNSWNTIFGTKPVWPFATTTKK
ncbi:MAG: hypothetical protein HY272_07030 [Gammaproteobacteria bacterium]|nr:hypothetical protein [Gammaproteobacteria bacterium]